MSIFLEVCSFANQYLIKNFFFQKWRHNKKNIFVLKSLKGFKIFFYGTCRWCSALRCFCTINLIFEVKKKIKCCFCTRCSEKSWYLNFFNFHCTWPCLHQSPCDCGASVRKSWIFNLSPKPHEGQTFCNINAELNRLFFYNRGRQPLYLTIRICLKKPILGWILHNYYCML